MLLGASPIVCVNASSQPLKPLALSVTSPSGGTKKPGVEMQTVVVKKSSLQGERSGELSNGGGGKCILLLLYSSY